MFQSQRDTIRVETEGEIMPRMNVFEMPTSKVLPLLKAKALKKGRTQEEFYEVVFWLTGYVAEDIESMMSSAIPYGDFLRNAPELNTRRSLITGKVCGIAVEAIEDPLTREMRYLDKLVDELAKGWPLEKICRA